MIGSRAAVSGLSFWTMCAHCCVAGNFLAADIEAQARVTAAAAPLRVQVS